MEYNDFFKSHTYYVFDNILSKSICSSMTSEVFQTYQSGNGIYNTNPKFYDNLIQSNTSHIDKQGYSRKYNLIEILSNVTGCKLHVVPTYKTVDQAIQIYNSVGDGTNWHHDRSIFNGGRSFTFLTVIHNTSNQCLTVWTEKYGKEIIEWKTGKAVLIEKFVTYHSVTPLEYGDRILLTFTYSEYPYSLSLLHPKQYILNKFKNYGYLGHHALDVIDFLIFFIIICIIILIVTMVYRIFCKKIIKN